MLTRFFNHFKTYRVYYLFNIGVLIGGIIFGFILMRIQEDSELVTLSQSILEMLSGSYIQDTTYVTNHLLNSLSSLFVIYVLAMSIIAIPFLSFLLFYKGMQIGFTACLYLYIFEAKGIIGIVLTLLPYLIFEFLAYFVSFAISYEVSLSLFLTTFVKKQVLSIKEVVSHLLNNMIWALCLIVLSVLTQIYVLPTLFSLFMN